MDSDIHTHKTHTQIHTHIKTESHTHKYTQIHTHTYTNRNAYKKNMHAHTDITHKVHTQYTHTRARTHTRLHTYTKHARTDVDMWHVTVRLLIPSP